MNLPDIEAKLLIRIILCLLIGSGSCGAIEVFEYRSLADQLDDLAYRNGIVVDGLELTASQPPQQVSGETKDQVKQLLSQFNYVTILTSEQSVQRIIILGEKQVFPREIILHTQKKGKNHAIDARVTGPNGKVVEVSLVIDTGADYLVLPKSLMETLELDPESFETRKLQTANGTTEAQIAKVKSLQLGNELISDVEAAFIEDEQLGDSKLLGMSVLQRYRVTLDDRQQTVTLIRIE